MQNDESKSKKLNLKLPFIIAVIIIVMLMVLLLVVLPSKKVNIEIIPTDQITKSIFVSTGIAKVETKISEPTKPNNTIKQEIIISDKDNSKSALKKESIDV
jgi:hypothetical protein